MDKDRVNKLDQLFQEKLQQHEISPEEDYWPYLEKNLDKISFYKFGWKHINIYNISLGIVLLTIPIFYLLFQSTDKNAIPVPEKTIDSARKSDAIENKITPMGKDVQAIAKKQNKQKSLKTDSSASNPIVKTRDSLPSVVPTEENIPVSMDPPKVEEKKPKQKKIIYVVQQDTIVEKDTVKVRRKRKK